MDDWKTKLGEWALRAAGLLAALGRELQGRPVTHLARAAHTGDLSLSLVGVPARFARGLRIIGADGQADEIVGIQRTRGGEVLIDRPLAQAYPAQTKVKVLV